MMGDFDRAAADFRTASQRDPSLFEPRMNLGIACIRTGKFAEAEAALTAAIHINAASAPAYTNRGIAFGSTGQFVRAIADFDTALMIDAHYSDAMSNREIVLRMLKGQQAPH